MASHVDGIPEGVVDGNGHAVFESRFSADAFASALRETYAGLGVKPHR